MGCCPKYAQRVTALTLCRRCGVLLRRFDEGGRLWFLLRLLLLRGYVYLIEGAELDRLLEIGQVLDALLRAGVIVEFRSLLQLLEGRVPLRLQRLLCEILIQMQILS